MKMPKFWALIASCLFIFILAACGAEIDTGTLSLGLSDATTAEYNAVYVTIEEVQVHNDEDGSWQRVASPNKTYNLLELVNGVREQLGITELETAHYTQMRLIIGKSPDDTINFLSESHPYANYIIDNADTYYELKIPSGFQTGVKIVGGFDINTDQTTELILDFDACRSVVQAGNSGKWLLKPTIKIASLEDFSIINGTVTDDSDAGIEGALVSAQIFNGGTTETKDDDELIIQAATITDSNGEYKLFVTPGTYNLVVYAKATVPDFRKVSTTTGEVLEGSTAENFTLTDSLTGTVSVDVSIMGADDEQYATLSFRQEAVCTNCDPYEKIEIKAINVVNGSTYETGLPVGWYSLAASSFGYETQNPDDFEIKEGEDTPDVNVTF
jgi:hypothetical protein